MSTSALVTFFGLDVSSRSTAQSERVVLRTPRRILLGSEIIFVLLLAAAQAIALPGEQTRAAGIGYGCHSMLMLACAVACWPRARGGRGPMQVQWRLFTAGLLASFVCYAIACAVNLRWIPAPVSQAVSVSFGSLSEAGLLLATTWLSTAPSRRISALDTMQALLFVVLRFIVIYSFHTKDHFTTNHLFVSMAVALFLFANAAIATCGAASRPELRFLRLLTVFLGIRFFCYFLGDQVSYVWLHHLYTSIWDVPQTLLMGGFAICLREASRRSPAKMPADLPLARRSLAARSLMPSTLALANLSLALCTTGWIRSGAVLLAVAFYVHRTILLQTQDAEERTRLQSRNVHLEALATRDALTGAGNRSSLAAAYANIMSAPSEGPCALLLLDVDSFKQANDTYGHLYGDQVLIAVANLLHSMVDRVQIGHCARFGGDEFALLLPKTSETQSREIGEEIRSRIAMLSLGGIEHNLSVSLGIALTSVAEAPKLDELISRADRMLYRAKTQGRNRVAMECVVTEMAAQAEIYESGDIALSA